MDIVFDDEETEQVITINRTVSTTTRITCRYIFKKGKDVGKRCPVFSVLENGYCKKHCASGVLSLERKLIMPPDTNYIDTKIKELYNFFKGQFNEFRDKKKEDKEEEIRRKNYIKIGKKFPHLGYGEVIEFEEKVKNLKRIKVHSGKFQLTARPTSHDINGFSSVEIYISWTCCHSCINTNSFRNGGIL